MCDRMTAPGTAGEKPVTVHDMTRDGEPGTSGERKQPYEKPDIQEVPLRPEEAVLGACKTSSRSGPAQVRCSFPTACSSQLS